MAFLGRALLAFVSLINAVSCVSLVAMMAIVFINVVLRAFGHPMFGVYESVGFSLAIMVAFSIAHCAAKKGHITVNVLEDILPKRVLSVLDVIVSAIGAGLYLVLAWQCYVYAQIIRAKGEVSMGMEIPFHPFVYAVAFGFFMLSLVLIHDLLKSLAGVFAK
jgi:C4-dicarboxylate transporter, DctQ subunit